MRALVLVSAALLAGCAAPPPASEPAGAPASDALAFDACDQTHVFAPYPVEAFQGMVPDGWVLQPADPLGRTTQFYFSVSACGDLAESWGYLFVVPPEGADENASGDLWPIGALVSGSDLLARYHAWGLQDIAAEGAVDVAFSAPAPAGVHGAASAVGEEETFLVDATAQASGAPFHDGAFRVWIPAPEAEGGVAGSFLYAWPEGGTEVGLGPGTLRYEGPLLNAPPAGPALVHMVSGVSVNVTRTA